MIDKVQLRDLIKETLTEVELYSQSAEDLVYGTICVESKRGTYLKQLNNGPALGITQMESDTHNDIWRNYLAYKPELVNKIVAVIGNNAMKAKTLIHDLKYAIIMCRIHYLRIRKPLPKDLNGMAEYWKDYYNTHLGAGTVEKFLDAYD